MSTIGARAGDDPWSIFEEVAKGVGVQHGRKRIQDFKK